MSIPHTTETVQWGANLVFKIGGRIYAILALEPADHWISFKCSPEDFADLIEREGAVPAPYLARAQWVALESEDCVTRTELRRLLRAAYDQVFARLTKKVQRELRGAQPPTGNRTHSTESQP